MKARWISRGASLWSAWGALNAGAMPGEAINSSRAPTGSVAFQSAPGIAAG